MWYPRQASEAAWSAAWAAHLGTLLLCALLPWTASAQEQSPLGVVAHTVDGDRIQGLLNSLGSTLELAAPDRNIQILRGDLIELAPASPAQEQAARSPARVLLVNGDILVGRTESVEDDVLKLHWTGPEPATAVAIPLEFVQSIVIAEPEDEHLRRRLMLQWGLRRLPADRILLLSATSAEGEVREIDAESAVLQTSLGEVHTPRTEIAAVMMNSNLATEPELPEQYAIVSCVDGSRVTVKELQIDEKEVAGGKAVCNFPVQLKWNRLRRVRFFGQRVVSLAHVVPADYVHTPYLTRTHPLVAHRNVYGGPLQVRDRSGRTGLGMASGSAVTFDLTSQGFRLFRATAGVDHLAGKSGHAVFAVEVDGIRIFESPHSGGEEPLEIGPLNVADAAKLTLLVEYGSRGNIRDAADWLDPILIR